MKPINTSWEKEFDRMWNIPGVWSNGFKVPKKLGGTHYDYPEKERIKSFIRDCLYEQKKAIIAKLELISIAEERAKIISLIQKGI